MADLKNIKTLTEETLLRDQPFIDSIKNDLSVAIDTATQEETEYKIEYDINTALNAVSGPLQEQRIKNYILKRLKELGYRAKITTDTLPMLEVTWTIAELSVANL